MVGLGDFLQNASQTIQGVTNSGSGLVDKLASGVTNAALGKVTGDPRSLADLYAAGAAQVQQRNDAFAAANPKLSTAGQVAGNFGTAALLPTLSQAGGLAKALGGAAWNVGQKVAVPAAQVGALAGIGQYFGGAPAQPATTAATPTTSSPVAAAPAAAPASVAASAPVAPHVAALAAVPHAAQDLHPSTHTAMDFVNANRHLTYYDLQQMEASLPKPLSDPTALARQTVMDLIGQSTQNKLQALDKTTKDQATPAYATAKSKILDDHLEMLKKHILVPGSLNPYIAQAMEAQQQ